MDGKGPSRPIDAVSNFDPESPTTKKSRKELQQLDAILADDLTPQNKSVPKSNGEIVDKQVVSEIMVSNCHLNAPLCVSAGDISELGKKMPSSHRMIRRKVISVKPRPTHELLGENDASDKVSPLHYVMYLGEWLLHHLLFVIHVCSVLFLNLY